MSKAFGKDLIVMVGDYVTIGCSRSCTIETTMEMQEVSSPTTGTWKTYIPIRSDWSISCSGLVSEKVEDLYTYFTSRSTVQVYLQMTTSGIAQEFAGTAYIADLQVNGELREMATYTVKFQGTGELTLADIE